MRIDATALSVIVPALNEETAIESFLDRVDDRRSRISDFTCDTVASLDAKKKFLYPVGLLVLHVAYGAWWINARIAAR